VFHDEYVGMKRAQEMYKRAVIEDPESITADERREMVNLYDEEIRYADAQFGAFVDELDERGILEETLVIVTADHGDAFGEQGYYGHPRRLDDELLGVPLVIHAPDTPAREVDVPASVLDIVPTVLDVAGADADGLAGESLFGVTDDKGGDRERVVYSQVRGDSRHDEEHLRRFRAHSRAGWAWMEREIESGEVRETAVSDSLGSEAGEALLADLDAHSERLLGVVESTGEADASKDVERRLEALGYK